MKFMKTGRPAQSDGMAEQGGLWPSSPAPPFLSESTFPLISLPVIGCWRWPVNKTWSLIV